MATPVILPKQGNSVETCILQSWLKEPGEPVAEGEAICEVETDKATVEVVSPAAGVLVEQFFGVDDDVPVMTHIAAVGEAGEDVSALRPDSAASASEPAAEEAAPAAASAAPAPVTAAAPVAVAASSVGSAGSSPRARALAGKHALPLDGVAGSGPDGRVIERDVQAAVANAPRVSPVARAAMAAGAVAPANGSGPGGIVRSGDLQSGQAAPVAAGSVEDIPVKGIRKVIAERMMSSLTSTAQLTLEASAPVASLQAFRAKVKANAESLGLPNITLNDMILYAVSRVLPRFPELNAHFLGDSVRRFGDVNLGVAVDTDKGLLVPVVHQAQLLSLAELSSTFKPIAKACQAGKADPSWLQGGTFTVTNLGSLGIEHFTPVLNAPEVAILGVGGITTRPQRQKDGSVEFEDVIALSLTIDHQATDGAPAARFLQSLVAALRDFDLLLAQ